jgi:succinylglutamate desuccinylase
MTRPQEKAPSRTAEPRVERILGRMRGKNAGPSLVVVSAIHGNEPAGIVASRNVLAALADLRTALRGEVVAVVGNVEAARRGVRYQVKDLNRAWTDERVDALTLGRFATPWDAEDAEQVELFQAIERTRRSARGPVTLLDLHTTSGSGPPFTTVPDSEESRRLAAAVPLTCVRGLVECLDGTMLVALSRMGISAAVVECGQNEDAASIVTAEAALWIALVAAGLLEREDVPHLERCESVLANVRGGLPLAIDVVYRHAITPDDRFRMAPGFRHFQSVTQGQILGQDARGIVLAPQTGYILMPLYQGLGDDGFFIAR